MNLPATFCSTTRTHNDLEVCLTEILMTLTYIGRDRNAGDPFCCKLLNLAIRAMVVLRS